MPNNNVTKVTVLGGSAVGTPELVEALRQQIPEGKSPAHKIALVLHGRTPVRLAPVARVAKQMAQGCKWLTVSETSSLTEALTGADYIINQIRVGGLAARAYDETFPLTLDIPGEETVGPGGFANALRTVPEVVRLCREIERHAPDALLLSFTNPASVIQYAVTQTTKLRVIGLCDGPVTTIGQAANALNCPPAELSVDYVGMHHFGFITRVIRDGQDVTEAMLGGLGRVSGLDMDLDLIGSLGALPTPYFKYFLHADRMLDRQRKQPQSRAEQLLAIESELLKEYSTAEGRPSGLSKRGAKWYSAIIAPVLMALIERKTARFVLNVINHDTLPWLPSDAIIETVCLVEAGRVAPVPAPMPNHEIRGRVQANCAFEQLMVEAILEQSEDKALRALTMNPLVPTADQARRVLKMIWPDANPARAKQ